MGFYGYNFWGMNFIWWIVWVVFMIWIFATPYSFVVPRNRLDSALEILRKRFASGEISKEVYMENKKILEQDSAKKISKT